MMSFRYDIFCTLVSAKKPMTLSQIARRMKVPRQNVAYHIPALEDSGIVIRDGDDYFCQPIFVTEPLLEATRDKITEIFQMMLDTKIYTDDIQIEDQDQVAKNCLQAMIFIVMSELDS
ncbi:MAG: helix-turn-helix domain-containing protein [Bacteroidales bacterium]|jgi:DNA-binding transcriptional ArsR family regulator